MKRKDDKQAYAWAGLELLDCRERRSGFVSLICGNGSGKLVFHKDF
jgi:hypothetical protein